MSSENEKLTDKEQVEFLLKWISVLEEYVYDTSKGEVAGQLRGKINGLFFALGSKHYVGKDKNGDWYVGEKGAYF